MITRSVGLIFCALGAIGLFYAVQMLFTPVPSGPIGGLVGGLLLGGLGVVMIRSGVDMLRGRQ